MNSIATRTGDDGTTGLLFNRRLSKTDPRIETNGWIDELSTRLGALLLEIPETSPDVREFVGEIQRELVPLMGVIALAPEDFERYTNSSITKPNPELLKKIDARIETLEKAGVLFEKWTYPSGRCEVAWHLARTGIRHAEREIQRLRELDLLHPLYSNLLLQTFNRLSDLFWLEAKKK